MIAIFDIAAQHFFVQKIAFNWLNALYIADRFQFI